MAKIHFDIKYRPQIESGEYKVVTGDDKPVRIICWDRHYDNQHPIVALAYDARKDIEIYINASVLGEALSPLKGDNLFIITPEPEFTEFEEAVGELIKEAVHKEVGDNAAVWAIGRGWTDKLLDLAREELEKGNYGDDVFIGTEGDSRDVKKYTFRDIQDAYKRGHDKGELVGKERALIEIQRDHEGEEWLSPDDFMAYKEQAYQDGVREGKAEALKNLPRWKKCANCTPKPKYSNEWIFSIDSENVTRESAIVHKGYFLPLDGLEKLPKED